MKLKLLLTLLLSISLTACDAWKFDGGGKQDNPVDTGGKVGEASELLLIQGSGQTGLIGTSFGDSYITKMVDSKNRPIATDSVNYKLQDCGGTVYDSGVLTSNSDGEITYNPIPSFYGCGKIIFEVVSSSNSVLPLEIPVTIIGPPNSITVDSGDNQTITSGNSLGAVVVKAFDSNGELVPNAKFTINASTYTANASGQLSYTFSSPSGIVGNHSFDIDLENGNDSKTISYSVSAGSPATITISSGNNQTVSAGSNLGAVVVNIKDANSNNVPSTSVSIGGSNFTTDASGDISYTASSTSTVAGSHQIAISVNSLSANIDYTVVAGALASLSVYSGNNQTLPRSVDSNNLVVKGVDAYSNVRTQGTDSITFSDGSWSDSATMDTSGYASMAYPTPLITGNKTITASSGAVNTSFALTVNDYTPLTATISTSDDLTYSVITERIYTAGEINPGVAVSVATTTTPSTSNTLTKTGSGTAPTDGTTAEVNLNTSVTNVTFGTDILSIISSSTFPAGVSANSCSFTANVIDGLTCNPNGTMTFRRDEILGGDITIKVQSSNSGGPEDYKNSNTLSSSRKIIIKKYTYPSSSTDLLVAGGDSTDKVIYIRDPYGHPAVFDYENEVFTQLATNITMSSAGMFYFSGRFVFFGTNPDDSNNVRIIGYDPDTDTFAEVVRIQSGSESPVLSSLYNGTLYLNSGTYRKTVGINPDWSTFFTVATTSIGSYFPLKTFGGDEYGFLGILSSGIYKKTSATQITKQFTWSSVITGFHATTDNYILWGDGSGNGFHSVNASGDTKLGSKDVFGIISMGSKALIATQDDSDYNKIYVFNDADNSYKKLKDFNVGGDDFTSSDLVLIGTYNNVAYFCMKFSSSSTIYAYDGVKISQLVGSGVNCSHLDSTSKTAGTVVDNYLWFGTGDSLYKICDQSSGCSE